MIRKYKSRFYIWKTLYVSEMSCLIRIYHNLIECSVIDRGQTYSVRKVARTPFVLAYAMFDFLECLPNCLPINARSICFKTTDPACQHRIHATSISRARHSDKCCKSERCFGRTKTEYMARYSLVKWLDATWYGLPVADTLFSLYTKIKLARTKFTKPACRKKDSRNWTVAVYDCLWKSNPHSANHRLWFQNRPLVKHIIIMLAVSFNFA